MAKFKQWGGKVWSFFGDYRVGLVIGGSVLNTAVDELIAGGIAWSAVGFALAAHCIWASCSGLAEQAKARGARQ